MQCPSLSRFLRLLPLLDSDQVCRIRKNGDPSGLRYQFFEQGQALSATSSGTSKLMPPGRARLANKTAKTLGLAVPLPLLADEVIE